jgi:hypothetical protein
VSSWKRIAFVFAFAEACSMVHPRGEGRTVFVDAAPEAAAVGAQVEKQLSLDGYRVVRGPEGADLVLHLGQESAIDKQLAPLAASAYTLKVGDRRVTSLDSMCRGYAGTLAECHADTLLHEAGFR